MKSVRNARAQGSISGRSPFTALLSLKTRAPTRNHRRPVLYPGRWEMAVGHLCVCQTSEIKGLLLGLSPASNAAAASQVRPLLRATTASWWLGPGSTTPMNYIEMNPMRAGLATSQLPCSSARPIANRPQIDNPPHKPRKALQPRVAETLVRPARGHTGAMLCTPSSRDTASAVVAPRKTYWFSIASGRQFCQRRALPGKPKTILWIIVLKQPNAAWR